MSEQRSNHRLNHKSGKSLSVESRRALEREREDLRQKAKDLKADFYHRMGAKWGIRP